jgi:hypothetical protein
MRTISRFTEEQIAMAKDYAARIPPDDLDPRIEALVNDLIGRVADKSSGQCLFLKCWRKKASCDSRAWAN